MLPQSFTERMQGLLESEYEEFLASFEHEKYQEAFNAYFRVSRAFFFSGSGDGCCRF